MVAALIERVSESFTPGICPTKGLSSFGRQSFPGTARVVATIDFAASPTFSSPGKEPNLFRASQRSRALFHFSNQAGILIPVYGRPASPKPLLQIAGPVAAVRGTRNGPPQGLPPPRFSPTYKI